MQSGVLSFETQRIGDLSVGEIFFQLSGRRELAACSIPALYIYICILKQHGNDYMLMRW